jgi:hypothetical protein
MNAVSGAVSTARRGLVKVADTATAAAGAVSGAAINGVVGGARGAVSGVRHGLSSGSQSSAAAALTIGAIGAAGLVEWPVLVAVGGAALIVHRLGQGTTAPTRNSAPPVQKAPAQKAPAQKAPAQKAQPRKATKTVRKATAPRRTTSR